LSPEEKKTDFGSITSLLKKSAEDNRKGEPAAEVDSDLPSTELPESFALPGGEEEAAGGLADQFADEPLEELAEGETGRSGGQAARALKVGGLALLFGLVLAAVLWGLWRKPSLERRYQEGARLIAAGQDEEAAKAFAECQLLEPNDGRLYVAYAEAYERRGDAERALELVSEGLRAEPAHRDLLNLQGKYGLQRDDLELAEKSA
jgi:tetratricopeptide (TPR) repeat protein